MRRYGTPSFLSSTSSRMEISADAETGTDTQLRIQPYLCVSYDKEEDFYQPLRLVNAVFVGPVLMAAAAQVESPLLKVVTWWWVRVFLRQAVPCRKPVVMAMVGPAVM
jgi:hypothetical protein